MRKVLVVQSKKDWAESDYKDADEFLDLPIEEDEGLPRYTYYVKDVA